MMNSVKDLIYFDYDKAKSLNSQLSGGIISEITRAIEEQGGLQSEVGFDIKLLKAKVGASADEKTIKTERIELYHELLNEVENKLTDKNVLKDLNNALTTDGTTFNDFLGNVPNYTYIKANGWSSFEDYGRFKNIMCRYPDL